MTKIKFDDTNQFKREGFIGNVFVDADSGFGFDALLIDVNGRHPKKRILNGNTRVYFVIAGSGKFILDEEEHEVSEHDMFIVKAGSTYEYSGTMKLFEFNVSPDNSFLDEKI